MEKRKFLERPPWSDNKVSMFIRVVGLAYGIFIACVVVYAPIFIVKKDVGLWEVVFFAVFSAPLNIYILIMLLTIWKTGKAPVTWMPWK